MQIFKWLVLLAIITGCTTSKNVHRPVRYITTQDFFLAPHKKDLHPARLILTPDREGGSAFYSVNLTFEEYLTSRPPIPTNEVVGIVTNGTLVAHTHTVTKFVPTKLHGQVFTNFVDYGTILSGPFAGTKVDLTDLTRFNWLSRVKLETK